MSRKDTIIYGDDQTIEIPSSVVADDVTGGTAYYFVVPIDSTAPTGVTDPAALITSTVGPLATDVDTFDFALTSAAGAACSKITPGTYVQYARYVSSTSKVTTIRLKPRLVEVIPPSEEGDC